MAIFQRFKPILIHVLTLTLAAFMYLWSTILFKNLQLLFRSKCWLQIVELLCALALGTPTTERGGTQSTEQEFL